MNATMVRIVQVHCYCDDRKVWWMSVDSSLQTRKYTLFSSVFHFEKKSLSPRFLLGIRNYSPRQKNKKYEEN